MSEQCFYFDLPISTSGNQKMPKDTEKKEKQSALPTPLSEKAFENLYRIQEIRRKKNGRRPSLKAILNDLAENAKA